jgi:hypothetical protein
MRAPVLLCSRRWVEFEAIPRELGISVYFNHFAFLLKEFGLITDDGGAWAVFLQPLEISSPIHT